MTIWSIVNIILYGVVAPEARAKAPNYRNISEKGKSHDPLVSGAMIIPMVVKKVQEPMAVERIVVGNSSTKSKCKQLYVDEIPHFPRASAKYIAVVG